MLPFDEYSYESNYLIHRNRSSGERAMVDTERTTAVRAGDQLELRDKLAALANAWANGDADAYAAVFAEDAQYVAFDGSRMYGREQIADGHRELFARYLRGSILYSERTEITFPTPDVAIIHARGAVLKRGQQTPSKRRMSVNTTVAARRDGHWCLVAFHNTRYRPFSRTLLGKVLGAFGKAPRQKRQEGAP
jgi:uncharacterized protein (TIGR02246 family)